MSNTIVGGQITVTIGSAQITLSSNDLSASPQVYTLPPGQTITVNLGDLNTYLNLNFSIPAISFPGITETNLTISSFSISTAGIFDIALNFAFGNGQGWQVFPGFTLNQVGLVVNYSNVPVITSLTPSTGTAGTAIVVSGNDLAAPTSVTFGTVPAPITSITNPTATAFTIPVPSGITAAGNINVTVVNADGTSNAAVFAYTT